MKYLPAMSCVAAKKFRKKNIQVKLNTSGGVESK